MLKVCQWTKRYRAVCSDWDDYIKQPLWYNCDIRIDRKPTFFRLWYDNGIRCITDLIDYGGRIISFERFQILYGFTPNFVSYFGIKNALLKDIRKRGLTIGPPSERPFFTRNCEDFHTM